MAAQELLKTVLFNNANLKAYYRFESGALTTDSSGNGHTLTNQTAVGETTGVYGGGGAFNGSHYMYTANTTALNITGAITVGCWVNFNAVAEKGLVSKGQHGDTTFQWALRTTSTSKFAFGVDDNGAWGPAGDAVGTTTPSTGVWYFVVGVYDGAAVRIYVNGKHETSTAYSSGIVSKTGNVYIGTFFDTSYLPNATIDEVFIFNTALSADQIKELYEGRYLGELRPNQFGTTAGLYHLSDTTDSSGNGYNLTNNNSVGFVAGKLGNCADFGATNTNKTLNVDNNFGLNGGTSTFMGWFKQQTEIGSGSQIYLIHAMATSNTYFVIRYEYNSGTRRMAFGRGKIAVGEETVNYTMTTGTTNWYHLVLTYDNTNVKGYVNGNLVGTQSASGTSGTGISSRFTIGADRDLATAPASIFADEVMVSSTALTANQIRQIYALGVGKYF